MAIPEQQLTTWSHQGAIVAAQVAHTAVRNALAAANSPVHGMDYDVYLQGSYRSDTNVRADSDVDVVVQLNATFGYDLGRLPADQAQSFQASYPQIATYLWNHFRADVLRALRLSYGAAAITEGNRCLKVPAAPGRVAADVLPAIQYRKYEYFLANAQSFHEGVKFYDRSGRMVVNFPKAHYDNGVAKNSLDRTGGRFKQTVRMFKNARTRAIERGFLADGVASSYFVDCLIWNVPDNLFSASFQTMYCDIVNHLHRAVLAGYFCRNGIIPLFGTSPEQWTETRARLSIAALARLWNEW